jgi:putative membrane protein
MIDYDSHSWREHLFDIRGSMLRVILRRTVPFVVLAGLAELVHHYLLPLAIPSTAHALIGVALGLLLVFRTNASYDRFWEGRKAWGGMVNESRNLGRLARVLLGGNPGRLGRLLRWTIAYAYASMHYLRGGRQLGPVAAELPPAEVEAVLARVQVPLAVAGRISAELDAARREGQVSDVLFIELDANVQQLVDYIGICERIHRTPLPFAYVVHLRRGLIVYTASLPFALLGPFGWGAVVGTFLIGYALFGIEEIGVEIEDPFGTDDNDLPLERICGTIDADLRALLPA